MPFDGKDFQQVTKPDVFSLEGLIAWLEKRPADGAYDWWSRSNCMLCQYLASHGLPAAYPEKEDGSKARRNYKKLAYGQMRITGVAMYAPRTYGAALTRARALQARS